MREISKTELRKRKRMKARRRRNLIIIGVLILALVTVIDKINLSRGILKINKRDVAYVEFLQFKEGNMKTVKDTRMVNKIIRGLKQIRGPVEEREVPKDMEHIFINIYDKTNKKWELAKSGQYLKINGTLYNIGSYGSKKFDAIFEKYSK